MLMFLKRKRRIRVGLGSGVSNSKPDKRKSGLSFSRLVFYFLAVSFAGVTCYVLFFSDFLAIKKISIKGASEIEQSELIEEIEKSAFQFLPGGLSRRNWFLFSSQAAEEKLKARFKKIKEIKVRKIFPESLEIELVERTALVFWCARDKCFLIDEEGYAYEEADLNWGKLEGSKLIKIRDVANQQVEAGKKALDKDYLSFLLGLRENLERAEIDVENEWLMPSSAAEEVEVRHSQGWKIFFSSRLDSEKSVAALKLFLQEEMKEEMSKELEYVDLRAENKIYYKLREKENNSESESSREGGEDKNNKDKKEKKD